MPTLWTRCDEPRSTLFTELGGVVVLVLALRTVHVPSLDPLRLAAFAVCN